MEKRSFQIEAKLEFCFGYKTSVALSAGQGGGAGCQTNQPMLFSR